MTTLPAAADSLSTITRGEWALLAPLRDGTDGGLRTVRQLAALRERARRAGVPPACDGVQGTEVAHLRFGRYLVTTGRLSDGEGEKQAA